MIIKTPSLDKAAFYTTFGAEISEITETYPDNIFILDVPMWLIGYEKAGGWLPYNKFCNQRRRLKRKCRKLAGLPEYFTGGRDTGPKLGDNFTLTLEKYYDDSDNGIRNRRKKLHDKINPLKSSN